MKHMKQYKTKSPLLESAFNILSENKTNKYSLDVTSDDIKESMIYRVDGGTELLRKLGYNNSQILEIDDTIESNKLTSEFVNRLLVAISKSDTETMNKVISKFLG